MFLSKDWGFLLDFPKFDKSLIISLNLTIGFTFTQNIEFENKFENFIREPNDWWEETNLNITEENKYFNEFKVKNKEKTNQKPFRGRASFALMMNSGKKIENMAPLKR